MSPEKGWLQFGDYMVSKLKTEAQVDLCEICKRIRRFSALILPKGPRQVTLLLENSLLLVVGFTSIQ